MPLLPQSKEAWARLALFPFKAYIVLAPMFYFGWLAVTEGQRARGARAFAAQPIEAGLAICFAGLLVAALIGVIVRRWKSAATSLTWAAIALLLSLYMMPLLAT